MCAVNECDFVILRVRMWIEIIFAAPAELQDKVILRVRMWIEIILIVGWGENTVRHPPCEDVD